MLQDHEYGASACVTLSDVCFCTPALSGTMLHCLVAGAHGCDQLAGSRYAVAVIGY